MPSLSARRAWIEIAMTGQISVSTVVALRTESVDRNIILAKQLDRPTSLSARRAWIEIIDYVINYATDAGRSPQGERG